jgi:hypothetical protein
MDASIGLAEDHHVNNGQWAMFNPESFRKMWSIWMELEMAVVMKRESGGELKEAMGAIIYENPNTGVKEGSVNFWFVKPNQTGLVKGMVFMELCKELKIRGVRFMTIASNLDKNHRKVSRFLESVGFKPVDVTWKMEI